MQRLVLIAVVAILSVATGVAAQGLAVNVNPKDGSYCINVDGKDWQCSGLFLRRLHAFPDASVAWQQAPTRS